MSILEKSNSPLQTVELSDDVELIYGADNNPLLYNKKSKKYVRISPLAVEIVQSLDGNTKINDITDTIAIKFSKDKEETEKLVQQFFFSLQQAGLLNIDPLPLSNSDKVYKRIRNRPILKLPLIKSTHIITSPFNTLLKYLSRKELLILLLGISSFAIVSLIYLFIYGHIKGDLYNVQWSIVIIMYIFHFICHELGHATMLKNFDIDIREAGIGLLYFFMPIAYVDTTDSYRLKRKFDRATVAIIGPIIDLLGACISAYLLAYGPEYFHNELFVLLIYQIGFLFLNMNPLLPTDGFHAIEAYIGELNFRQRSFEYLLSRLNPKKTPIKFERISKKRKKVYLIYGVIGLIYLATMLSAMLFFLVNMIINIFI